MPPKRDKPVTMHRTLADLPELEHFESEEQKNRALAELEKEAGYPFSWDYLIGIAILIGVVVAVVFALGWLVPRVPIVNEWPRDVQRIIRLTITVIAFLVTLRLLHRWGAGEQLRAKLIASGVPVCRGCGYSLKGLPPDASKCPECGRDFDDDVIALVRKHIADPRA